MRYYGDITKQLQFILVKRWVKTARYIWIKEFKFYKELRWTSNFTPPTQEINYGI